MAPRLRPQQRRIKWPLTANQVEAIDEMLETLFRAVRNLESSSTSSSSSATASSQGTTFIMLGDSGGGDGGDFGMTIIGGPGSGASSSSSSINMAVISTRVVVGI